MKKLICLVLMLLVLAPAALAQSAESFTLWFEEGFSLGLPQGWVSYPVDEEARAGDIRYILSNEESTRHMYILYRPTTFSDISLLDAAITADEAYEKTGDLVFDSQAFIAFSMPGQDTSGCMTLHDGHLLAFVYNPQSDSDYMLLAASIMDTFDSVA